MTKPSAASLSIVPVDVLDPVARPKPPRELNLEQQDEWRAVVDRLPADWFPRETWGLLAQYCRLIERSRRVAETIEFVHTQPKFDGDMYDKLVKLELSISRTIAQLATTMRISQQSTYDKSERKPRSARRPWEV